MKRITALLLTFLLIIGFPSCKKKTPNNTSSSALTASVPDESSTVSDTNETPSDPTENHTASPEGLALLQQAIETSADTYGADAIQVAVIRYGKVTATAEYGWAVKETHPLKDDSLIRVASISKTVVAMVAFRLIEEGRLSLDDDISKHLGITVRNPNHPNVPITVRMLLNHTSSFKSNPAFPYSVAAFKRQLSGSEVYTSVCPGTRWSYNNYAFGVLGAVCEFAAGKDMTTLAREYFFEPMEIDAAFTATVLDRERLAVIYSESGGVGYGIEDLLRIGHTTTEPGARIVRYVGNLTISASDYARLMTLLISDGIYNGRQLLSKESIDTMLTPYCTSGGVERGLPVWRKAGLYGLEYGYYHTGSSHGVYTLYVIDPETDCGIVVCTTGASGVRDSAGNYAVCGDIAATVFKDIALF